MPRGATLLLLLVVAGCGDDDLTHDAGTDARTDASAGDAGSDARMVGALSGPEFPLVGQEACYETALVASSYVFAWGDGTTTETDMPRACHTWSAPGAYSVGVTAGARTADRAISVLLPPAPHRPTRSTPILYDAARDRVWAVTPDADAVSVVDATTLERVAVRPTCRTPRNVALRGDVVWVTCEHGDALARFDAETFEPRGEVALPAGSRPFAVVAEPGGDRLAVSLRDVGVALLRGDEVLATLPLPDARALTWGDEGVLLVSRWRADADGARVHVIDTRANEVVRTVLLPRQEGLDSDTDNSGVPSFLDALAFTPDGFRAMVGATKANVVTGLHRTGTELSAQTTARAMYAELLPAARTDFAESGRFSMDDLDYVSAIAPSARGDRLYLSLLGAQRVVVLEAYSFSEIGSIAQVGAGVRGLALDARGRLFVHADLDRALHVYEVADLSRDPERLASVPLIDTEPLAPEVLRGKRLFYAAFDPRISRTSYLSCGTCHLDGEHDGLTWDFTQRGEGLRNTIDLRGRAGTAHGPVHWTGNFDEIQDFENDIRGGQGGAGLLSDADFLATMHPLAEPKAGRSEDLDALAAYVASLASFGRSPWRAGADFETRRENGERVFAAAGCPSCHAPPRYTDSALDVRHDVGTLGPGSGQRLGEPLDGLDTPTLRGLWASAPYLHDGGAATLREVLVDRNPEDAHGRTSGLSETELANLELFLLSLDDEG